MLDESLKAQLKVYLERVIRPIHIHASADDTQASREMLDLLESIVLLSDKVVLKVHYDDDQRKPSFALRTPGEDISLRFAGLPMGHEFASLVLGLLQVGGHPPKITDDLIERVRSLDGHYCFETYFSVSCQSCPDVVQALNMAAVLNPRIEHVAIDGAQFQKEVETRQIMSVPTVYLNGELFDQGRMTLEQIVAKLDTGTARREAETIQAKAAFDVLVVGGGPAGAAAAVYAARKGIRTGLVAERFGGQVLDTMTIENFISVPETDGPKMAVALEQHVRQYEVDLMNLQRAKTLTPAVGNGLIQIGLASGVTLSSRTVILSTGARWRQMNVPGEDEYRNKGVAYCPHCDGPLFKGKRVAVIGGGNSGVEAAIDLAGIVSHVTLLEFDAKLRADEVLQRKLRSMSNVEIIMGAQTTEVCGDGKKVVGLVYTDRSTGGSFTLTLEGVFVQIGLLPNTEWLKGAVALSSRGEIVIDERGQTSIPGVFAAGDATTVPYKQIVIAMGEGSKAALGAFDYLIRTNMVGTTGISQAA
ncbi:MAG TPA: alkyl hydroperoxide reductase subunit F [Xylella sp.]